MILNESYWINLLIIILSLHNISERLLISSSFRKYCPACLSVCLDWIRVSPLMRWSIWSRSSSVSCWTHPAVLWLITDRVQSLGTPCLISGWWLNKRRTSRSGGVSLEVNKSQQMSLLIKLVVRRQKIAVARQSSRFFAITSSRSSVSPPSSYHPICDSRAPPGLFGGRWMVMVANNNHHQVLK